MKSLIYILLMSMKNRFLEVLRKPAKLILYLIVIGGLVTLLVYSIVSRTPTDYQADMIWLKLIIFIFFMISLVFSIVRGLKSGEAIFEMNDVNLLFVSPIRPQTILFYGIIRAVGMSFLAGIFILFQGNSLGSTFGIDFKDLLLIWLVYTLTICLFQIITLIIYSLTNGNPRRKIAAVIISVMAFLPMITAGIWYAVQVGGNIALALEHLLRSPITSWTPIVGWTAEGTVALITGNLATGILFFGVTIVTGALLILYIIKSNPDYYEDTLVATETAFQKKRALAEGQINMEALSDKRVKVAATGVGGVGASAFFFKHLRESFRANRLGLWGFMSILMVVGAIAFALIATRADMALDPPGSGILIILQVFMLLQVFLIGTGRGLIETYSHYIYMVPETSFQKILWGNMEVVFKIFVEAVLAFGIAGIILGEPLVYIIGGLAVYTLFSLMLIGLNFVSLRVTGESMSVGILVTLYLIAVVIIMLPGLILALIVGSMIEGWGILAGFGVLATWELIAALACFAISQEILHRCDMPVMKMK